MSNNQHLNPNNSRNFTLFGHNSILIGTYLLLFVYALRSMLDGFLLETSMLGMMSIEIIELTGLSLTILFAILSGTAVFFSCRRNCRKNHIKVWNTPSKRQALLYLTCTMIFIVAMLLSSSLGLSHFLSPIFLSAIGIILLVLNKNRTQAPWLMTVLALALAMLTIFIPMYWYSALLILGIAFVVYGMTVKK